MLLFYALEYDLKATLMRRQQKRRTDLCQEIHESQHDINKLLDCLGIRGNLRLAAQLSMSQIKDKNGYYERKFTPLQVIQRIASK